MSFIIHSVYFTIAPAKDTCMADPPPYPGTPRWVKASGIILGVLAQLAAILLHAGAGSHRHMSLYKPQGITRYGWRKRHERPARSQS
jgi:hypothetical protein